MREASPDGAILATLRRSIQDETITSNRHMDRSLVCVLEEQFDDVAHHAIGSTIK
jgi:hypothetical protein